MVELPWKTGLCASSHKTWWSSTTCCTLSPDFPPRRLWTGLCFLSLSLSLLKNKKHRLRVVTESFGECFMRLREIARVKKWPLWNVTPKVHKMQHVPLLATVLNPRCVQNYAEESLIGTCTAIWARSVKGKYRTVAQKAVLAKKLTGLMLHFEMPLKIHHPHHHHYD